MTFKNNKAKKTYQIITFNFLGKKHLKKNKKEKNAQKLKFKKTFNFYKKNKQKTSE